MKSLPHTLHALMGSLVIAGVLAGAWRAGAGSISGAVTAQDGVTPIADLEVTAWKAGAFLWTGYKKVTAANGTYSFTGLGAGTYRIEFNQSDNPNYAHQTYSNVTMLSEGLPLTVTADSVHTNINGRLPPASKIAGKIYRPDGVTGLAGITATAHQYDTVLGWRQLGDYADSDGNGVYLLGGLASGVYRVQYEDFLNGDYVSQVYSNARSLSEGSNITVTTASTTTSINVTMHQAGKISGQVWGTNGTPLADGSVDALVRSGSGWDYADSQDGYLDASGRYTLGGLSSGTYRVQFVTYADDILDEIYDDALERDQGEDVVVTAGATVSNINAVLDRPAWPPRIVRQTLTSGGNLEVAYTSTSGASCVLEEGVFTGTGFVWTNADPFPSYNIKGVNTMNRFGSASQLFLRVVSP